MRNITIEGTIVADKLDDVRKWVSILLRSFTPKSQGVLSFHDRQISCIVEESNILQSEIGRAPNFFVSLLCPYPFFEYPDEIKTDLAVWESLWEIPWEIPEDGFIFSSRQSVDTGDIQNIGDVPCGIRIVFRATGGVTSPEIVNSSTGEFIRIDKIMAPGEEIQITTHFANKRVISIIGSTETNVFFAIAPGSSFFQLDVGINSLTYDAASGADLLEVSIFHRPQFLGV